MSKWMWGFLFVALPCLAAAVDQAGGGQEVRFDQVFHALDVDRSGKLSRAEVEQQAPALAENFDQIDANHDGGLSKAEIRHAFAAAEKRRREFSHHLAMADKDKNGRLSKEEAVVLPNISAHFDEIDSNHDGELVLKEIADYVRANANKAPVQAVAAGAPAH